MTKKTLLHIAIDGPAGAGKSSVAREVARQLGICYLDTGAMYRALSWKALQKGLDFTDTDALTCLAKETSLYYNAETQRILCDGTDVSDAIRLPQVSACVSAVAAVPGVREYLTEVQRRHARECSFVLDGRDIGRHVLPDARVKIYLTADLAVRALRRQKELGEQGHDVALDKVSEDIARRDEKDSHRAVAPLARAEDAVLIDTSQKTFDEVVEEVLLLVRRVGGDSI